MVKELLETQLSEDITDNNEIQPDSSADGMVMAQKSDLQVESEILQDESEIVDYMVECEVVSENFPGKVLFSNNNLWCN